MQHAWLGKIEWVAAKGYRAEDPQGTRGLVKHSLDKSLLTCWSSSFAMRCWSVTLPAVSQVDLPILSMMARLLMAPSGVSACVDVAD